MKQQKNLPKQSISHLTTTRLTSIRELHFTIWGNLTKSSIISLRLFASTPITTPLTTFAALPISSRGNSTKLSVTTQKPSSSILAILKRITIGESLICDRGKRLKQSVILSNLDNPCLDRREHVKTNAPFNYSQDIFDILLFN